MSKEQLQIQEQEVEIPKGVKLLEDVVVLEFAPDDLVEANEKGKRPYLKGRFGWVDKATANKRLYPRDLMSREIARISEDMHSKGIFGELGHPHDGKTDIGRVSHFVTDAEITENGEILGRIEFIPGTKNGDQALAIARAGGKLGVSSRGFGTTVTDSKGNDVVQEDYRLVTWDIVADPANAGAHPEFVVEHKETTNMDLETLKKNNPELVEAIRSEAKKELEIEARDHAREALREEFEERLKEDGKSIREEAVEVARKSLLEDPEVAGSATAIEEIKKVISPFIFSEDENKEVIKLKERNRELEMKIAEQDKALSEMHKELAEASNIATELGYHLYLERELHGSERAKQIAEMLGDVTTYKTLDDLKQRVEEISEALAKEDEAKEQYEDKIRELEKRLQLAEEARDRALEIGKKFGIRAYVERKVADNPQSSKLRLHLDEAKPVTKDDVDRLVEDFNAHNPTSEEFNKIRSSVKENGPRRPTEEEMSLEEDNGIFGVPMSEIREISDRMSGNSNN